MTDSALIGKPWHLWLVEQLAYFYNLPFLVVCSWAIAIWSSVLGSLLLLFAKRLSVSIFLVSLMAMIITFLHNYAFSNGYEVMGGAQGLVIPIIVTVIAIALYFYARAMAKRGVLS